jgi:outer membrane protein assembly factor BamE (lipoprotein component of BamABCDE complex)
MRVQLLKSNVLERAAIIAALLILSFAAQAQDAIRVDQLEREIQAIKQRLSKLESPQGNSVAEPKPSNMAEGWKSQSSWRQLKSDMSPNEVRAILGEPSRVNGGNIANWYYTNGGEAIFMREKLYRWTEPN